MALEKYPKTKHSIPKIPIKQYNEMPISPPSVDPVPPAPKGFTKFKGSVLARPTLPHDTLSIKQKALSKLASRNNW